MVFSIEHWNSRPFRKQRTVIVGLIVLAACIIRITGIGRESLWLDEGYSLVQALKTPIQIWQYAAGGDLNPPLYYYTLHYWIFLVGQTEISMRLLSAIYSAVSVWLVYRIARRLTDPSTAILASLLTALSVYHLHFAQELRAYSLFGMLGLISMMFLAKLSGRCRWPDSAYYVLSTAAALYSHPYAIFHWFAQNVFFAAGKLLSRDSIQISWKHWIALQAGITVLFSPWLWVMVKILSHVERYKPQKWTPQWVDLPGVFKAFAGDNAVGGLLLIIFLGLAVISQLGLIGSRLHKRFSMRWQDWMLWLWFLCPVIIAYAKSRMSAPIFHSRYMVEASFACFILAAGGMMCLRYLSLKSAAAGIMIFFMLYTLIPSFSQIHKEQWRDAAGYIEQKARPGDLLLFHSAYCHSCVYWYYSKRNDLPAAGFPIGEDLREITEPVVNQHLPDIIGDHNRIWLILSHVFDQQGLILRFLVDHKYSIQNEKSFYGIKVYCLEKNNGPSDIKASPPVTP